MKLTHLVVFVSSLVASAQAQSGLLLGIHSSDGSNAPSYKTYWIIADAAGPRLAAILPDLMHLSRDGFWRN